MTLTLEQQAIRARGIGASESPALLGLDPYKTRLDIYLKKLGLVEDVGSHHTERGEYLEPGLRQWASKRLGLEFVKCDPMAHPEHPLVLATPDGAARDGTRTKAVLELKAPGPRMEHEWGTGDEAPDRYVVQLVQQMFVFGAPVGFLAALIDGDLRIYRFERDRELEELIREQIESFWHDHIETGAAPSPDGSPSHSAWLKQRFPKSTGEIVLATPDDVQVMAELRSVREQASALEQRQSMLEQMLKERIGDAAGVQFPGLGKVTWTNNKSSMVLDHKAMAAAHPDIAEKFMHERPGPRVFRVNFTKEK